MPQILLMTEDNVRVISWLPLWTMEEMKNAEREDPDMSPVAETLEMSGTHPEWSAISCLSSESKMLFSDWK